MSAFDFSEVSPDGIHALLARWDAWGDREMWRRALDQPVTCAKCSN